MSLRRPTVARTVFISCYKPFMWCRLDARLWHYYSAFSARGVFQTLVWRPHYYSAFSARGVFQTLVWHQYYHSAFSARGVIQTLVWHPVFYFGIFLSICVHHGFSYIFVTDVWSSIKSGLCWIYYTRVLNVCEYIQTYSLACPWLLSWPDCLAWRYASRWHPRSPRCWHLQPREDRSYPGQLFLWEMESHRRRCIQPLPPSTTSNQVLYS